MLGGNVVAIIAVYFYTINVRMVIIILKIYL